MPSEAFRGSALVLARVFAQCTSPSLPPYLPTSLPPYLPLYPTLCFEHL